MAGVGSVGRMGTNHRNLRERHRLLGTGALDWLILSLGALTPIATFGLLFAAVWHLVNGWRAKAGWWNAISAVLLVLAAAVLAWVAVQYNLYGFSLVF